MDTKLNNNRLTKSALLLLLFLCLAVYAGAQTTYYSSNTGTQPLVWNDADSWTLNPDGSGGGAGIPGRTDNVFILSGHEVVVNNVDDNGSAGVSADGLGLSNVGAGSGGNTFPDSNTPNFFHKGDMTVEEGAVLTFGTRVMFDGTVFVAGTLNTSFDIIILGNFYFAPSGAFSSTDDLICSGNSNTRIDIPNPADAWTSDDIYLDHTDAFVCGLGILEIGRGGPSGNTHIINLNNGADYDQICSNLTIIGCDAGPCAGTGIYNPSPPALTGTGGSFEYIENNIDVIDAGIGLTFNQPFLTVATISVTAGYTQGQDTLVLPPPYGIVSNFDGPTGVLTLRGFGTVATWEAVLQSVTFEILSDNPTTTTRTVEFQISDGFVSSNTISRDIIVTPVNDPPDVSTITGTPTPLAYDEGEGAVAIDTQIEVNDPDDTNMESARVYLTNYVEGEDFLDFTNAFGITNDGFNSTSGELALSGTATLANYELALRSVTYENTSHTPDLTTRTANFVVNDGDADSPAFGRDINISATNDLPTVAGTLTALDYTEGDGAILLDDGIVLDDLDNTNLTGAVIAITTEYTNPEDVLGFTDQGSITGVYAAGTLTLSGTATIADYQAALRSITYENTSENPNPLTRQVSITVNDGTASSMPFTRGVTIAPENDIPTITGTLTALNYTEEDGAVILDNGILVNDVDNTNLSGAVITISTAYTGPEDVLGFTDQGSITGVYATGTLTLSGSATLADYQAALRTITYENTSDNPNTTTRQVSIIISDGTDNSLAFTRDIAITPQNDIPTITGSATALDYTEGDGAVLLDDAIIVNDIDNANLTGAIITISTEYTNPEDVLGFTDQGAITGVYATGTLTLSGSASLADYQTALRSISYENTSNDPNTLSRQVSLTINDGTGNSLVFTRDITIAPTNDLPTITGTLTALDYTEGDGAILLDDGLLVDDLDNTTLTGAIISISTAYTNPEDILGFVDQGSITGVYAAGTLTLSGTASLADYQTALRSITYENTSENPNTVTRQVSITINDGISASLVFMRDITITPANDLPTIVGTGAALDYTEGDGAVLLDDGINVNDVDNVNLIGAVISITTEYTSLEDVLGFTNQGSITGTYVAGTLTLSGSASLADYQLALRSITYENLSDNPNALSRQVRFTINDGTGTSLAFTRDITITPQNDLPSIGGTSTSLNYTEGDGAVPLDNAILVFDLDDTDLSGAVISVGTGFTDPEDVLGFTDQNGILGAYVTGTLTLSGTASLADYQAALRSITYENTSDDPNTLTRVVSFTINDGTGNSLAFTRNITITPQNDLPTLSGTATALNYTEGDGPVILDDGILVNDLDNINLAGAIISIITEFTDTEDVLGFVDQGTISGSYGGGTLTLSGSASLADYQVALRSITYENTSSNPNTLTRTISFIINDGADNSMAFARDIVITPVNNIPVLDNTITALDYNEGDGAVPIDDGLLVNDVDNANMSSATITISANYMAAEDLLEFNNQNGITGTYLAGTMTLSGAASLANYQTALRAVTYSNSSEDPDPSTRTISFVINDGTDNSASVTREINVTPVNDMPTISGSASNLTYNEGAGQVVIDNNLFITDIDNTTMSAASVSIASNFTDGEDLLAFTDQLGITGTYANGVLTLTGSASLADYMIALGTVTYENTSSAPNDATRTVEFTINDGLANSNPFSRDIIVVPFAEATVITNLSGGNTLSLDYTEGDGAVALNSGLEISDPDDINLESVLISITSNYVEGEDVLGFSDQSGISGDFDTATGVLTLAGTAAISDYLAALLAVTYENTSENPSSLSRTIEEVAFDGDVWSNTITLTLTVNPVNDAPTLAGQSADMVYQESSGAVAIDNSIEVFDIDSENLSSATVQIASGYSEMEDLLEATTVTGISRSFDPTTGILTLTGQASLTDYQSVLRSVTYTNTSVRANLTTRTIEFVVNDGALASEVFSRDIIMEEVIDPVIVYQVVTPDNDTMNDTWVIDGIEQYPNNTVQLFNRWNNLVYRKTSYENTIAPWNGQANEGVTNGDLADGTYFYSVDLGDGSKILEGFLVLKRK